MNDRLTPCVHGCGAMTLHEDGACQSCRVSARTNGDLLRETNSDALYALNDAGRSPAPWNGRDRERFRRGFAMMRGVTA